MRRIRELEGPGSWWGPPPGSDPVTISLDRRTRTLIVDATALTHREQRATLPPLRELSEESKARIAKLCHHGQEPGVDCGVCRP